MRYQQRPPFTVLLAFALGIASLSNSSASAQDMAVVVPKHSCTKPEFPGRLASDNQRRTWRKDVDTYSDCIKKYATDQQKNAELFVKAGNAAIDEYNTAVKEFQEDMTKAAQ